MRESKIISSLLISFSLLISLASATLTREAAQELTILDTLFSQKASQDLFATDLKKVAPNLLSMAQGVRGAARIRGAFLGCAVGSAVGAKHLLTAWETTSLLEDVELEGGGPLGLPPGHWTDEVGCTLCLAMSLFVNAKMNLDDQLHRYYELYYKPTMSELGKRIDLTNTTSAIVPVFQTLEKRLFFTKDGDREMLLRLMADAKHRQYWKGGVRGNETLIRLPAIPVFFHDSVDLTTDAAASNSSLTHDNPAQDTRDACKFLSALVWSAIRGVPKAELLLPQLHGYFSGTVHLCPEVRRIVRGVYRLSEPARRGSDRNNRSGSIVDKDAAATPPIIPSTPSTSPTSPIVSSPPLAAIGDASASNGDILTTLLTVLWLFENDGGSFEDGLKMAVRTGGDTSGIAAVYGMVAGACYGYESIPQRWREGVFAGEFISDLAALLSLKRDLILRGLVKGPACKEKTRRRRVTRWVSGLACV